MKLVLFLFGLLSTAVVAIEVINVTPKEVVKLLESKSAPHIIDVRTVDEHSKVKIAGSLLIDVTENDFEQRLAKLDPQKTYILHCRSGSRSKRALKTFKKLGFVKVYHLNKGMIGWQKAGMKTE